MNSSSASKNPRDKGFTEYAAQGDFMKVYFIEKFTILATKSRCTRMAASPTSAGAPTSLHRPREGLQTHRDCRRLLAGG